MSEKNNFSYQLAKHINQTLAVQVDLPQERAILNELGAIDVATGRAPIHDVLIGLAQYSYYWQIDNNFDVYKTLYSSLSTKAKQHALAMLDEHMSQAAEYLCQTNSFELPRVLDFALSDFSPQQKFEVMATNPWDNVERVWIPLLQSRKHFEMWGEVQFMSPPFKALMRNGYLDAISLAKVIQGWEPKQLTNLLLDGYQHDFSPWAEFVRHAAKTSPQIQNIQIAGVIVAAYLAEGDEGANAVQDLVQKTPASCRENATLMIMRACPREPGQKLSVRDSYMEGARLNESLARAQNQPGWLAALFNDRLAHIAPAQIGYPAP